jgi:4-cresol dehydrogenase (hydroxylating)
MLHAIPNLAQTGRGGLDGALQDWTALLGPENVITGSGALAEAARATFATRHAIPAILRPAGRAEVEECVRIANRRGVVLYPISSGKNWGYGSRVPTQDGSVLLDLGRMNRILDFSEELAYVTVEPGVTQRQLFDFLRQRGSRLWMDATGASPDCSLIGNTVERGFGHTPYGDHFAHSCGLEVVLPTGETISTGFSRFEGAKAGPVSRAGVGPILDGLFSQSNFGIVTRMSLWLMPEPEYFQAFYFRCDDGDGLAALVDALRPLRLNGTLRSTVHIGNDYKVVSALQQYPWAETQGRAPLPDDLLARLRRELRIGRWNGSGGLYGSRGQVAEARRMLRQALKGKVQQLQFLDDRMLRLAGRFATPYRWLTGWDLSRALELLRPVYGLMKGIPTEHPIASTYWRKRTPPPEHGDPDRDGCGLLWCSPICAADGRQAAEMSGLASDLMLKHGFEPMFSISMVNDRSLACVMSICYDRDAPGEDERAQRCHDDLRQALASHGFHPYRLDIHSMSGMAGQPAYTELLRALKKTVDPNGVLAAGRYQA